MPRIPASAEREKAQQAAATQQKWMNNVSSTRTSGFAGRGDSNSTNRGSPHKDREQHGPGDKTVQSKVFRFPTNTLTPASDIQAEMSKSKSGDMTGKRLETRGGDRDSRVAAASHDRNSSASQNSGNSSHPGHGTIWNINWKGTCQPANVVSLKIINLVRPQVVRKKHRRIRDLD